MIARPAQFVRAYASVIEDAPLADRDDFDWGILALADPEEKWGAAWAEPEIINTRCIPVCVDEIADLTQEQWEAVMASKYGPDFEGADCLARYGEDIFGEDGK